MGLFNLFEKKEIVAELILNNSFGKLLVSDNLFILIPKEKFLTLVFFSIVPQAFFLVDSPTTRMFFIDFLMDLKKENFERWTQDNHLPEIRNLKFNIYKNKDSILYVKLQISFLGMLLEIPGIRNEIEFATLMIFFIIYLYENTQDKLAIKSFLEELLSGISTIPLSAVETYNYVIPISTKYFDKMNIKL